MLLILTMVSVQTPHRMQKTKEPNGKKEKRRRDNNNKNVNSVTFLFLFVDILFNVSASLSNIHVQGWFTSAVPDIFGLNKVYSYIVTSSTKKYSCFSTPAPSARFLFLFFVVVVILVFCLFCCL